jgi:hypothetical protein
MTPCSGMGASSEITREVDDLATRRDEIEHVPAEVRRVTSSSHGCLLLRQQHDERQADSTNGRARHPLPLCLGLRL